MLGRMLGRVLADPVIVMVKPEAFWDMVEEVRKDAVDFPLEVRQDIETLKWTIRGHYLLDLLPKARCLVARWTYVLVVSTLRCPANFERLSSSTKPFSSSPRRAMCVILLCLRLIIQLESNLDT